MLKSEIIDRCIHIVRTEDIGVSHMQDRRLLEDFILRSIHRMEELKIEIKGNNYTPMSTYHD